MGAGRGRHLVSAFARSYTCNNIRAVIHALPRMKCTCVASNSLHNEPRIFIH